jgi:hypothetical protein
MQQEKQVSFTIVVEFLRIPMNKMSHDVCYYKICLRSYFTKPVNQCGTELKQSSSTFTLHWNVIESNAVF